jgi:hypothetical protein
MQGILLAESLYIHMDDREENFFSAKIASGQALFPPLVKAKNQHQNFEKHLKQKRCTIRRLNVLNFVIFLKNQVNMVKNVENCSKSLII